VVGFVQGFVKDLLDVADNLDRAYSTIQEEVTSGLDAKGREIDRERALSLLRSLLEGVKMTDNILLKVW
jgi:molecular chaperone GrpE (heat shock protein)